MPILQSEFSESEGQFSPDGRWVAYTSDESGQAEVYVRSFQGTSASVASAEKWQISANGGSQARWRGDGKELFYLAANRSLMSVDIRLASKLEVAAPNPLFTARVLSPQVFRGTGYRYAAAADGRRFLMVVAQQENANTAITAIVNWKGKTP